MWQKVFSLRSKFLLYIRHRSFGPQVDTAANDLDQTLQSLNDTERWALWSDPDVGPNLKAICSTLQADRRDLLDMKRNATPSDLVNIKQNLARNDRILSAIFATHFKVCHQLEPSQSHITKTFKEFIMGITFFHHPQDNSMLMPVYHLMTSCGPYTDQNYATFHRCYANNPNQAEAEQRIKTCYVERLIYDRMYKNMTLFFPNTRNHTRHAQDRGHRNWLQQTNKDFQTCYPKTVIRVWIPRYERGIPMELRIEYYTDGVLLERQHYTRTLLPDGTYDPFVFCQRWIVATNTSQEKFQAYAFEEDWTDVPNTPFMALPNSLSSSGTPRPMIKRKARSLKATRFTTNRMRHSL